MVEVARDEAEAGRREGVTRSSTVLEVGLCAGAHWGAMAGFRVRGGALGSHGRLLRYSFGLGP